MEKDSRQEFIIFDVETTGLSPQTGDRIIEIGALKIRNLKAVAEFHTLVNPDREISPGAFAVNGITQDMVAVAPLAQEVLPAFLHFVGENPIVAHNARFDMSFLGHEMALAGMNFSRPFKVIDTLRMARGLLPGLGSYALAMVAYALGIEDEQTHRAMDDVRMTHEVFCRLFLKAEEENIADTDTLIRLFGTGFSEDKKEQEKISLIATAIEKGETLYMEYFSPYYGSHTQRKISPRQIIHEPGRVRIIGFCHLRNEEREFRLDRIVRLEKIKE